LRNLNKILSEINKIESSLEVNNIIYDNVLLWPIIRIHLINNQIKGEISTFKDNVLLRLLVLLKDSFTIFRIKNLYKKNIFFVYGYDPSGKYTLGDKCIHKQGDPIKDYVGSDNFYFLEFGLRNYNTPRMDQTINISLLFVLYKIFFYPFILSKQIKRKRKIKNQINDLINKSKINVSVWNDLNDFFIKKYFFDFIIKIVKPKKIFLKAFTNTTAYSLIYSCNLKSIPTIEYQHGQQGDNSITYTNWFSVPKNGYKMLPKTFWLWDNTFANKFELWMSKQNYHEIKIVGNLWQNFIEKNDKLFPPYNLFDSKYKNVLVCMQKTHLPEIIKKAICSDTKIMWYFRLHPREYHNKKKLNLLLKDLTENYNIDIGNQFPLESFLQTVDAVVTEWSTVAYEATLFKKKAIVIHQNGQEAFKSLISRNLIYYAEDYKKLLEFIKN